MNDAFIALQNRDELMETLFFAGLDYTITKKDGPKKVYVFTTKKFSLTLSGRHITIDGVKMKSLRAAKQYIAESVL